VSHVRRYFFAAIYLDDSEDGIYVLLPKNGLLATNPTVFTATS
jgi:hypothetical protein